MKRDFQGRVVWVTGASSGIGRGIAKAAAARGARLILSGRRPETLGAVADECVALGAPAEGVATLAFDLEDGEARARSCERAAALLGPLDIIVLNAGVSQRSTFLETSPEAFDRIMLLDFEAQVDITRRCLPAMVARRSGCLVAISSFTGLAGMPVRSAYSAAKHALAGFFQSIRAELVGTGLRVVTVSPGYVKTGVGRNALAGDGRPMTKDDPNIEGGADPDSVAMKILDSILGGAVEFKVAFDFRMRLGLFLSRYAPSVWARLSARHVGLR